MSTVNTLITILNQRFDMKNLGSLHYFLVRQAHRDNSGIFLNQMKYVMDILARLKLDGCKPVKAPVAVGGKLSRYDGSLLPDGTEYRCMVGSLQYLTMTRPDIACDVNQVCQFLHAPQTVHLQAVKRILRYIKGTIDYGLHITPFKCLSLQAFSDADWPNA